MAEHVVNNMLITSHNAKMRGSDGINENGDSIKKKQNKTKPRENENSVRKYNNKL